MLPTQITLSMRPQICDDCARFIRPFKDDVSKSHILMQQCISHSACACKVLSYMRTSIKNILKKCRGM